MKVIDGLSREPKDFAIALHSKGFIAKHILQEIVELPATSTENARKLYTALLGVVENYPTRYREFVSMLQDNDTLYGDLLNVLEEEFSKIGECHYSCINYPARFAHSQFVHLLVFQLFSH